MTQATIETKSEPTSEENFLQHYRLKASTRKYMLIYHDNKRVWKKIQDPQNEIYPLDIIRSL